MRCKAGYILFHDDAHLEKGCVENGIVVDNLLAYFPGQAEPFLPVKGIVQAVDERIGYGTAVMAVVVRLAGIDLAHEIITRIACRCRNDGLGVNVVGAALEEILVVIRSVDVYFDTGLFQGCLGVFC